MMKVTGRCDDMLIVRGVNLFPTQIEEIVLACPALAPHFQIELSRPDRLDRVRVRVERRAEATTAEADRDSASLGRQAKELIGLQVEVEICDPGALARSTGKAQRVVDLR